MPESARGTKCDWRTARTREKQVNFSPIERGQRFRFRLGDVICPDAQQAISQITPELEVTGRTIFLSDCGEEAERFAVLEVNGVCSPLVVPVERLQTDGGDGEVVRRLDLHEAVSPGQ
jgi:hypothetical protein